MKHDSEEFRKLGREVVKWMADYFADPRRYPVRPNTRLGDLVDRLPASWPV